ncbi:uncharacterized protein BP5553_05148 [Venustampulla echinocandica]|uniref:Uncharacterized protein n=1 Tax=Venustampulla echinocandica TaxID=2656787 RepID=A0A370TQA8_9HELO|nr:uncharacterized protein BP5553_05148 [Venustampulla echinocandica]RDL37715.1 hypothetical protein BP5553_05148 [Venustampulla echinocandica]
MAVFLAPRHADTHLHSNDNGQYDGAIEITNDISNETDWTKVKDITSRRRIQNRISQRNRRRKLKERQGRAGGSLSPQPGSRQSTPPTARTPPRQNSPYDEGSSNLMFEKTPYLRYLMANNGSVSSNSTSATPSQASQEYSLANPRSRAWTLPSGDTNSVVSQILHAQRQGSLSSEKSDHYVQRQGSMSSEKSDHYALQTPPTQNDFDDCRQPFWDPSIQAPAIEDSGLNLFFTDCDLFTPSTSESDYRPNKNAPVDQKFIDDYMNIYGHGSGSFSSPIPISITPPNSSKSSPEVFQPSVDSAHTDIAGYTPLHLAVQKGHHSIVQLLLEAGSMDLNAVAKDGMSPLHLALYSGNHAMATMLLEKGANCDTHNAIGQNVLHLAVERGDLALVQLVLKYIRDPNTRDCLGQTAFHCAVAQGHEEIVKFMLVKGINSQAKIGP